MSQQKFFVTLEEANIRLDSYLHLKLPDFSRSFIKNKIRDGKCKINDEIIDTPAYKVQPAQEILLDLIINPSSLIPVNKNVEILWKDKNFIVCNKPPGISVHPAPSIKENTFIQYLLFHFPQLAEQGGERPGIVHRLDKNTSGLLVIALNEKTKNAFSEKFSERKVSKTYLAIVEGVPDKTGKCTLPIGRHGTIKTRMDVVDENKGGRPAITEWQRLWHFENKISLLEIKIYTGRTHQIRVHLSHLGFPILGDDVYGGKISKNSASRQMLHAWKLGFQYPFSSRYMQFSVQPPTDFLTTLLENQKRMHKIIVTGNVGCGKTSFCKILAKKNIPIISADEIVAKLYQSGGDMAKWLTFRLGDDILGSEGNVNKNKLFSLMEHDYSLRKEIEEVVQSYVKLKIQRFFEEQEITGIFLAVAEVPLFFESGCFEESNSFIKVGIECDKKIRWDRLQKNRLWNIDKIETIEQWQLPEKEKMAKCDYVIDNNKDEEKFAENIEKFLEWLQKRDKEETNKLEDTFNKIWTNQNISIQ